MKLFVYEGSPKEIAEVAQLMGSPTQNPLKTSDTPEEDEKAAERSEDLSVEQISLVFTRRALGEPYRKSCVKKIMRRKLCVENYASNYASQIMRQIMRQTGLVLSRDSF